MQVIKVRNVHQALPEAVYQLVNGGVERASRNGPVMVMPQPVTTHYTHPRERVIFWPERDANPFFHFYESLWMLAGRRDVNSLTRFVPRMSEFSDDGQVFHGAYGYRWRKHFGFDQLLYIGSSLKHNPDDRRQVLQITDCQVDLRAQKGKRDIPCNLTACFQINGGALDMMVSNRSNDIVWGAYGANAVHFSMLQEYVAAIAGVPVGMYWQVSFNWHAYITTLAPLTTLISPAPPYTMPSSPYELEVRPFPLVNTDVTTWTNDLDMFIDEGPNAMGYRDVFFRRVALPMVRTHRAFKSEKGKNKFQLAMVEASEIRATDWRMAVEQWIARRQHRWEQRHG